MKFGAASVTLSRQSELEDIADSIARLLKKADGVLHNRPGFPPRSYSPIEESRFVSKAQAAVISLDSSVDFSASLQAVLRARETAIDEHGDEFKQDQFPTGMVEDACNQAIDRKEVELVMAFRARVRA